MSIGQSRDAVIANVAQQGSALLLLLAIPNLLSVEHFAEVVFVGVVLSFTRFADLGFSSVYGREMPRYFLLNNSAEIGLWNRTVVWFGVVAASLAGGAAGMVMYMRFGAPVDAAVTALLPPLTFVISTYASMAGVRSDFRAYRNSQVGLSFSRLLAIPFVLLYGLLGWFVAQMASLALVVAGLGVRWIPLPPRPEWRLVKEHLPAGLQLALISLLWTQLLDSGRLLASIHYPPEGIAIYGILVAGYQSVCTLVISAYMPVTVKTLGLFGRSERDAAEYLFEVIHRTLPVVFVLAIVTAEIAPWLLDFFFPKYRIDPFMPRTILYGLTLLPFIATLGNLFIGKHRTIPYLIILAAALAGTVSMEQVLRPEIGIRAAAVAQVSGTAVLAVLMVLGTRLLFADPSGEIRGKILSTVLRFAGLWTAYAAIKILLTWL